MRKCYEETQLLENSLGWRLYKRINGFRIVQSHPLGHKCVLVLGPIVLAGVLVCALLLLTWLSGYRVSSRDKWFLMVVGLLLGYEISRPSHVLVDTDMKTVSLYNVRFGLSRRRISFSHLTFVAPREAKKGHYVLYVSVEDQKRARSFRSTPYVVWESSSRAEIKEVLKGVFGVEILEEGTSNETSFSLFRMGG